MTAQLNLIYLHSEKLGYGYAGMSAFKAMQNIGIDTYDGLPGNGDLEGDTKRSKVCKDVLFLTVPSHVNGWYKGQRAHLFTMWEATRLPESMRDSLHNFETILVPSQANVELYSQYHHNVKYVPLGVDNERWAYRPRREDIFFNFLIGGSGQRKGTDLVYRAFMELQAEGQFDRTDKPIARLIMKNPKGEDFNGNNVDVISGYMSAEDEVELYASAHCYVQPSRGEGWGMQPLQAIAQGIPTILTDAHGHTAFADHGFRLDAELVEASYMKLFGDAGQWWEPDYEQLKNGMLAIYNNFDIAQAIAKESSVAVHRDFTWEAAAEQMVEAIGGRERLGERFRFPSLPHQFVKPEVALFQVITTRDWKADIGGVTHFFQKGKLYWKNSDVKRIMFESGILDKSCLTNDGGLSVEQLERLGTYIAEQDQCPTCGQTVPLDDEMVV